LTVGLALHSKEGELLWSLIVSSDFESYININAKFQIGKRDQKWC
jgi:hypothetical protein